jgi:hypothetical protein
MAYLIDRIRTELEGTGYMRRSQEARQWLRSKVANLSASRTNIVSDQTRATSRPSIGRMYFYFYDPKTKDFLEYYDKFPLVIPIEMYNDGFLGLNLHYVNPRTRLIILDKLSEYASNRNFDEKTKLRLSYDLLRRASVMTDVKPCIKKYLYPHVKSRMVEIFASEWDIAALLPAENFVGKSKNQVWTDSRKKI